MDLKTMSDSSVTFGNESCTLRYRRSVSASIGGKSTSFSRQCLPARSCDKCQFRSSLFARSMSENHSKSKCTDCGLLQKQKAMRKWRTLYMTFVVAAITRTTLKEEANESDNCSVDDKSRSSSQGNHIVDIINAASGIATMSDSIQSQIDQTHDEVQGDETCHHQIIAKATIKVTGSKIKFLFRLINMLSEICLAWLSQENGSNKLKNTVYWKLNLLISLVCFVISVVELIVEVRVSGAEWQRRGYFCWFYYPGTQGQLFGNFFLYLAIGSSGIQFIINSITAVKMKKYVNFEPTPLLLSITHFVFYKESLVECKFHGRALQCPQCFRLCRGNEHDSDQIL